VASVGLLARQPTEALSLLSPHQHPHKHSQTAVHSAFRSALLLCRTTPSLSICTAETARHQRPWRWQRPPRCTHQNRNTGCGSLMMNPASLASQADISTSVPNCEWALGAPQAASSRTGRDQRHPCLQRPGAADGARPACPGNTLSDWRAASASTATAPGTPARATSPTGATRGQEPNAVCPGCLPSASAADVPARSAARRLTRQLPVSRAAQRSSPVTRLRRASPRAARLAARAARTARMRAQRTPRDPRIPHGRNWVCHAASHIDTKLTQALAGAAFFLCSHSMESWLCPNIFAQLFRGFREEPRM